MQEQQQQRLAAPAPLAMEPAEPAASGQSQQHSLQVADSAHDLPAWAQAKTAGWASEDRAESSWPEPVEPETIPEVLLQWEEPMRQHGDEVRNSSI